MEPFPCLSVLVIVLAVFGISGTAFLSCARGDEEEPGAGLMVRYCFSDHDDMTVFDVSGHQRHGLMKGFPDDEIPLIEGVKDVAFDLAAFPKAHIVIPDLPEMRDATWAAWVRPESDRNWQGILSADFPGAHGGHVIQLLRGSGNMVDLQVLWNHGSENFSTVRIKSSYPLLLGQWAHVALTVDAERKKFTLFVNGVDVGSAGGVPEPYTSVHIGHRAASGEFPFGGAIADVRIYGRALSEKEVIDVAGPEARGAIIYEHPQSQTVLEGSALTLSAGVGGRHDADYQWYKDGGPVEGATAAELTLKNVTGEDDGMYHLAVYDGDDEVKSRLAHVKVLSAREAPAGLFFRENIRSDYPGGNIIVEDVRDDKVLLRPDLSNTRGWWFWWNFRVTGAQNRTVTFEFKRNIPIARRGPAVSTDGGRTWSWLGEDSFDGPVFEYDFAGEAEVRFAFGIPYQLADLQHFLNQPSRPGVERRAQDPHLRVEPLATTPRGRVTPRMHAGQLENPAYRILIVARQHACEVMGSYVLEGFLDTVLSDSEEGRWYREHAEVMAVPFMDLDGVEDGEQGKNRDPRDHNQDWSDLHDSIHPEVAALKEFIPAWSEGRFNLTLDLHCPWIRGHTSEVILSPTRPRGRKNWTNVKGFFETLDSRQTALPFKLLHSQQFIGWEPPSVSDPPVDLYDGPDNPPRWETISGWTAQIPGIKGAAVIEIPYANAWGEEVTAETARAFGKDLASSYVAWVRENPDRFKPPFDKQPGERTVILQPGNMPEPGYTMQGTYFSSENLDITDNRKDRILVGSDDSEQVYRGLMQFDLAPLQEDSGPSSVSGISLRLFNQPETESGVPGEGEEIALDLFALESRLPEDISEWEDAAALSARHVGVAKASPSCFGNVTFSSTPELTRAVREALAEDGKLNLMLQVREAESPEFSLFRFSGPACPRKYARPWLTVVIP